ncbi:MAG: MEKHLA domain-containing protein [Zetaproteobacteria bacterium CG1_02_53_45]|nr:MAG: MEKHLA domain-containing protein [Zetaproteobacteria bacterium CG1_02_53_45]
MEEPSEANAWQAEHARLLSRSLKHWTGCGLMDDEPDPVIAARRLYFAPFVLLSHATEADPVINYANRAAQQLFEMAWGDFVQLPSRLSAEAVARQERDGLLRRVSEHGYIDDYSDVRVSSTGRRFLIDHATVWNLIDDAGHYRGQAAMFSLWRPL